MLKKVIKAFVPPIFPYVTKKVISLFKSKSDHLFDGDDEMFKRTVVGTKFYAEYGCGASTIWVSKNIGCDIFSVDSSSKWIDKVRKECGSDSKLRLYLADVGSVGEWGRPLSYQKSGNFVDYSDALWDGDRNPDVILIDGRFRVCCFLTCLLYGRPGTKILFDDYTNRPYYHFVEEFVRPIETCGRQALFVIPEKQVLKKDEIVEAIQKFRFVFD